MSEEDPHGHPHPDQGEPVGDLGEEAARLMAVLAGWTRAVDEHVATGTPECQWCPVCRVVHAVRSTSPEVRDHLASAVASLAQAAAGLLAPPERPGPDESPDPAGPADPPGPPDDGMEHIDLDEPEGER